ncbi:TPA: recombinase family protein [Vibrio cholerae]|nr:recombinase family protein [Vibrio cholerae]
MIKAYSYRRFSSKQQMKGDSLRRQIALASAYCSANNLTLSDQSFEDLGVSAFRSNNSNDDAGLGQFLQAVEEEKILTPCYLLVENLDRLSRDNIETALTQLMGIIKAGVIVVTLFDNHVYKSGMSVVDYLTALISMERANDESKVKSQRIAAVWQQRQSSTNTLKAKNCPFWLTVSEDRKSYLINEKVSIVKRIYSLAKDGLGSQVIAKTLNEEGVPPPTPRAKGWSDSTVSYVLNTRSSIGEYQPKQRYDDKGNRIDKAVGEPLKGFYPAIITEEEYYYTQDLIKSRNRTKDRNASKNFLNVVKGIATCAYCGSGIRVKVQPDAHYLQCSKRHLGVCKESKPINLRFLQDWLKEVWLTSDFVPITAPETSETRKLKTLEAKVSSINNTLEKLLVLLDDGDDVIFSRIKEKRKEKADLLVEIEKLKEALAPYNITKEALWKRFSIVKTAFLADHNEETIRARCMLAQLLNQLKRFNIKMDSEAKVVIEVTTAKGEQKVYHSAIRPYHPKKVHTGKVWTEV